MEQCLQKHQKQLLQRLEGIEEEGGPAEKWPPTAVRLPETPTETMEFLARSWSLSAAEISKALQVHSSKGVPATADVKGEQRLAPLIDGGRHEHASKEYETASLVKESSRDMTCYCAWQRAYWSIVAAQASEACSAR
ncbi:hypothetical protein GUJ93_ZPchr0189g33247 [Zizania palustris]|uniref:VAN3-binding protein-like auxin canalisation domain-containing protein n=1 Tax=Zizania palustris TaxID=103762 RepID=A0A8J5QN03_ZIZPA|nr:hypothetical protein GUJ93_ZPchr0189g33247 [Zizania palustris]